MTAAELRAATRRAIQDALTANESWKYQSPERSIETALCEVEAAIDAEIAAARQQWQPIENAPRNEKNIDLWVVIRNPPAEEEGYRQTDAQWRNMQWEYQIQDGDYAGEWCRIEWSVKKDVPKEKQRHWASEPNKSIVVTHWMPLPDAPEPP